MDATFNWSLMGSVQIETSSNTLWNLLAFFLPSGFSDEGIAITIFFFPFPSEMLPLSLFAA